jgi:hypothetical protein
MPIEIKITDIKSLTIEEIDQLHSYLIDTHILNNTSKLLDTEPKAAYETNLPENTTLLKTANKKKRKTNDSFTSEEVTETMALSSPTRDSVVPPPPYPNILEVATVEDPQAAYDELIAYVLENTKMKKLHFDQTMAIVTRFGLINLNSLPDSPHLIPAVLAAFKELLA